MSDHDSASAHHHILPLKTYLSVAFALLVLTVITVWVSFFQFGAFNLAVAMLIAALKASLVALFFMHLKYDNKLYLSILITSVLFLAVFIFLTMADTLTRGEIEADERDPIQKDAIIYHRSDTTTVPVVANPAQSMTDTSAAESGAH